MKKLNDAGKAALKVIKSKRAILIVLAAFALIGLLSYWSYKETMTELLNEGILTGQNTNSAAAAANKEDITKAEEETEAQQQTVTEAVNNMGFAMPLDGEIITGFSNGELVKSETLGYWLTHDGIDIAAENGTEVKSAGEGTVEDIYDDELWGTCVVINHQNGALSHYRGLNADVRVSEGDSVVTGQIIGTVGETATIENVLGAHLHFAIKLNGEWTDPQIYISDNS